MLMTLELLWSLFWFMVAIGILVSVHEFGHFWVARRAGVQVITFSIGFGPVLWRYTSGAADATTYQIAAVPLGGYVKMLDESEAPIAPEQRHRAFNRQRLSVRCAIVSAGPVFNLLLAVVAYWLMFMWGISGYRPIVGEVQPGSIAAQAGIVAGDQIIRIGDRRTLSWQSAIQAFVAESLDSEDLVMELGDEQQLSRIVTISAGQIDLDHISDGRFFNVFGITPARLKLPPVIGEVQAGSPAARAGLLPGDRLEAADGEAISEWGNWRTYITQHPGQTFIVGVRRGGERLRLSLTPATVTEAGVAHGRIGISVAPPDADAQQRYRTTERYNPLEGLWLALDKTLEVTILTLRLLWKMVTLELSTRNLSGPFSIAQYAGFSADGGGSQFLRFIAIISISLGILNLLPIPLLDGGHLLYYGIEGVTGRPVSESIQSIGQRLGILLLSGLMGLALYNDAVRLFS